MVTNNWSSCIELPIQCLSLGICADVGLSIYGGDATDTYKYSPVPNNTYLQVDDEYTEWYRDKHKRKLSKSMILPVKHAL